MLLMMMQIIKVIFKYENSKCINNVNDSVFNVTSCGPFGVDSILHVYTNAISIDYFRYIIQRHIHFQN